MPLEKAPRYLGVGALKILSTRPGSMIYPEKLAYFSVEVALIVALIVALPAGQKVVALIADGLFRA
jgi:hypothetical protein